MDSRRIVVALIAAIAIITLAPGCSTNKEGKTEMDTQKLAGVAFVMSASGATGNMQISTHPMNVGMVNGLTIDSGVNLSGHFNFDGGDADLAALRKYLDGAAPGSE